MGMEVAAESSAIMQTPGLADALSLLCLTRDDVNYLLITHKYLVALKPPVENGWVLPEDACTLLEGAVLLLREPLRARCIATTGTSDQGQWWACMDDGSTVLPHDVCEQEANDMDAVTLDALGAELRAALHRGCRQPITLTQSVAVVERIIQLNHCGEPVRRLWDLRQEAAQLQERLLRRALCPTPAADENHCGREGGDGGGGGNPATSLVALLDEGLGLAAQIAFTLRERLSDEERRQVEGMLRGFCQGEEEEAAAAAAASDRGKEQVAAGEVGDAATPTATVGTAAAWSGVAGPTGAGDRTPAVAMDTDDLPFTPATAVYPPAACRPTVSAVPASPERASGQMAPVDLGRGASADAAAAPPPLSSVIPEAPAPLPLPEAAPPPLSEAAPPPLPEAAPEASHAAPRPPDPHSPAASAPSGPPSSAAGSRVGPDGGGPYGAAQGAQPARRWGCGRATCGGGAGKVAGGGGAAGAGRWLPPLATQQGPSGSVGPLDTHLAKYEPEPTAALVSLELGPVGTAHPAAADAAARHSGAPYSLTQDSIRVLPASDANGGGGGGGGSHAAAVGQATTSGQRASSMRPALNSTPGSVACLNAAAAGTTALQQLVPVPVPGGWAEQQPIPVPVLGGWAGQQPIPVPVLGDWAEQQPIPVPVLGGWAGQQPIPVPVPGGWAGQQPVPFPFPVPIPGGWAGEQPIPVPAPGGWAGQQPVPGPLRRRSRGSGRGRGRGTSGARSGAGSRGRGGRKGGGPSPEEGQVGSRSRSRSRSRSSERQQPPDGGSGPEPQPPQAAPGQGGLSRDEVQRLRQAVRLRVAFMQGAGNALDLSVIVPGLDLRHRLKEAGLKLSQFVWRYMRAEFKVVKDSGRSLLVPQK